MRIQQLMAAHIQDLTTLEGQQAFKLLLAPIVAKTAQEQTTFYRIYEAYLKDIQQPIEEVPPPPPPEEPQKERSWRWIWGILFLTLLAAMIAGYFRTEGVELEAFQFRAFLEQDTIYFTNKTAPKRTEESSVSMDTGRYAEQPAVGTNETRLANGGPPNRRHRYIIGRLCAFWRPMAIP